MRFFRKYRVEMFTSTPRSELRYRFNGFKVLSHFAVLVLRISDSQEDDLEGGTFDLHINCNNYRITFYIMPFTCAT